MPATPFRIDFTAPSAPSNITVTNTIMPFDPAGKASSHNIVWVPVSTAPEDIDKIEVWTIDAYEARRIAWFSDPAVTSFLYHFPRLNTNIQYQIHQIVKQPGGGTQIGLWGALTGQLATHPNLSLVSVINPSAHRVGFDAWDEFGESYLQNQEWQIPAGGQNYFEIAGSLRGRDMNLNVHMEDRTGITALQTKLALEQLFDSIPPETMCLRHPRGGKWFGRYNGNISVPYVYGGSRYRASFGFRRTSFQEGN